MKQTLVAKLKLHATPEQFKACEPHNWPIVMR